MKQTVAARKEHSSRGSMVKKKVKELGLNVGKPTIHAYQHHL